MSGVSPAQRVRHPLRLRRVTVAAVRAFAPAMTRVTFRGATPRELDGFVAPGPGDHVKVFFPDPVTGVLTTPEVTPDGVRRPETGTVLARDYTPLAYRPQGPGGPELDVDLVLHGDEGPASAWAGRAAVGDTLAIAGPRGSGLVPEGITTAVLVADETALPAASRWLDALTTPSAPVPVTALLSVADPATAGYLAEGPGRTLRWFAGPGREEQVAAALRALSFDAGTFVFLAGEAGAVAPLRRYLRRDLGLPKVQVDAHGYWRRGVANLDHHAPLDPSDPD